LPRLFTDLGFTAARAKYLAEHITVDPSRGAGHAMGAQRKGDKAHLRTRVEPGGMNYKGYNIAVHELGHNVEQTFSLYDIDFWLLEGVPNTAFTEALAFLFQARDLELLGRPRATGEADRLRILDAFWNTREIAGSALVELDVWRWLYDHPTATATEIREATLRTARDVWNRYYAPTLGTPDTTLLAIYSHTISSPLYLFNYVLGHLIAFQVEEHVAGADKATFATEFERACRLGDILPDAWMTQATGKPVSTQPLLDATRRALGGS
jgi:oligoendopeptidase F